jgi:hypothetical protein
MLECIAGTSTATTTPAVTRAAAVSFSTKKGSGASEVKCALPHGLGQRARPRGQAVSVGFRLLSCRLDVSYQQLCRSAVRSSKNAGLAAHYNTRLQRRLPLRVLALLLPC